MATKKLRKRRPRTLKQTISSIDRKLDRLLRKENIIMSQIDDLKASVAALTKSASDELTRVAADLEALKADNPEVANVIASINAVTASLDSFDPHNPPPPPATT